MFGTFESESSHVFVIPYFDIQKLVDGVFSPITNKIIHLMKSMYGLHTLYPLQNPPMWVQCKLQKKIVLKKNSSRS